MVVLHSKIIRRHSVSQKGQNHQTHSKENYWKNNRSWFRKNISRVEIVSKQHKIRNRIYGIIQIAQPGDTASRIFDIGIMFLIALNVIALIAETVESIYQAAPLIFRWFEIISVAIFTAEYMLRIWSCVTNPIYKKTILGRFRFAATPLAVIDILAILPFYLPLFSIDLRFLRIIRFVRVFRIIKFGKYSKAVQVLNRIFRAKSAQLMTTMSIMFILLVTASSFMYYAERNGQPEQFSSIPASMWWGISTLGRFPMTAGCSDMYPITGLGKVIASILAILGIGMFAIPTSILGAGFVEEMQSATVCSNCGNETKRPY